MIFTVGDAVKFNGSDAVITSIDGNGTCSIRQATDYIGNIPLHMLKPVDPPAASLEEAVLMTLKNIDKNLSEISNKLTMLLMRP